MNRITNVNFMKLNVNKWKFSQIFDPRILLILLAFLENNVVRYFVLLISMIPFIGLFSSFIIPFLYFILFFLYIFKYKVYVKKSTIMVLLFVILSIIFTVLLYPQNSKYIFDSNNFWNTIFPSFRYFFIGLIMISDKKILNLVGKVSCLAILVEFIFVMGYMIPNGLLVSDEMSRAYQLLPNILFAINYSFNQRKIFPWIFSILGIIFLLSMGTRGPVLIMLAFIFIKFSRNVLNGERFKLILLIGSFLILFVLFSSKIYIDLLYWLKVQFESIGFSTRILNYAIEGTTISNTTGRTELYEYGIRKILERPILGYGVYGEWEWIGWNIHNMYLEILIHYGVFVGFFIIFWLFKIVSKVYIKSNSKYVKDLIIIWVLLVFIRGIFGGSYLSYGMFFLIGFCLSELSRQKKSI